MRTVFLRVLEDEDKGLALLEAVQAPPAGPEGTRFDVDPRSFASVPRSPFAYWVTDSVRRLFTKLPSFGSDDTRVARVGLQTSDDDRFVRAWWEVSPQRLGERWFPFAKGESKPPYYGDVPLIVGYSRADQVGLADIGRYGRGADCYFRPGLTWALRAGDFCPRVLPAGCIFSNRGQSCFVPDDQLAFFLALLNSRPVDFLFKLSLGRHGYPEFLVGVLNLVPMPLYGEAEYDALSQLAMRAWALARGVDCATETSHAFVLPALLLCEGESLGMRATAWNAVVARTQTELVTIQAEIDDCCYALYGIEDGDREQIERGLGTTEGDSGAPEDDGAEKKKTTTEDEVDSADLAVDLVSWAVGVAFGRFDVRLATGEREAPEEPIPSMSLPVCSPAMLTEDDGLPAQEPPREYQVGWPRNGIMVDDAGHSHDLVTRVRFVFDVAFGESVDAWWQDCAQLLGGDLRRWLARSFFGAHLKGYSESRRKAPVYWQLATPTASYSVWLYAHRTSADTLYRVLNEYVAPKLRHEEHKLTNRVQEAGLAATAAQRRSIEMQRSFVEELRTFRGEVARVAPLWRPEFDDGVLVSCAIPWRLVPQHRVWQRETKACWAKLVKGEYDWAHVAMHLWPERVVRKCATDRTLAVAHGLEDVFWVETDDGRWVPRPVDEATIERFVQERSSAAVKAALADLLAAG